jgi:hypothetical protein
MPTIQSTTDYEQFKFLEKNRPIYPKYLIESIKEKNMLKSFPIIVDKNMNIIDGQHRLKAAQYLGIPIFYTISEDLTENDMGRCQVQKCWTMPDYLRFYQDLPVYKFVSEIMDKFKYPIHFIIDCCDTSKGGYKLFRLGKFKIKETHEIMFQKFQNFHELKELIFFYMKNSNDKRKYLPCTFLKGLWNFTRSENYDHEIMMKAVKNYPSNVISITQFNSAPLIQECLKERVYNFKKRVNGIE